MQKNKKLKILFLTKHCQLAGTSRKIVFDYIPYLEKAGIECEVVPFFSEKYFKKKLHNENRNLLKATKNMAYFFSRYVYRIYICIKSFQYDIVVLEYEVIPYFPYCIEPFLKKSGLKVISLYDDAIDVYYKEIKNKWLRFILQNKIEKIVKLSDSVVVWNSYLMDHFKKINSNILELRSAVNTINFYFKMPDTQKNRNSEIIIGWIGGHTSFKYLYHIQNSLKTLSSRYNITLKIVSSKELCLDDVHVVNKEWSLKDEVDDLHSFDIGIMPLTDDGFARGKSGCKIIQYMAVGVPVVW
jgi:glycosyltransferase involved in cell wall biosynthesis